MGYSAVRERKSIIDLKPNLRHFKNSEKKNTMTIQRTMVGQRSVSWTCDKNRVGAGKRSPRLPCDPREKLSFAAQQTRWV